MPNFEEIEDIPHADATDKEIEEIISRLKVFKEDEFADLLHQCHNVIRNREKLDPAAAFDEIAKILFIKVCIERRLKSGKQRQNLFTADFLDQHKQVYGDPIDTLFKETKEEYRADKIFKPDETVNLKFNTVREIGNYPEQPYLKFPNSPPPFPGADSICLFSGGLDSLAGALYCYLTEKSQPILVSHRSIQIIDSRQKHLVGLLNERMQQWKFPHLSLWVNRKGNPAIENTQRSRSFLYLSIATASAYQLNINKIYLCENGIISFNIPKSGQNIGTMVSKSTHPRFVAQFQKLVRYVFSRQFIVTNPFILKTKAEVAKILSGTSFEDLIQASVSCASTRKHTKLYPHCGICSQCVDRRFSIISSGFEHYDKDTYEKDIFKDALKEGEETTLSESYLRTAIEIEKMDDIAFFSKYPEIMDAIPHFEKMSDDEIGKQIYSLFQRHSEEVLSVIKQKANKYHDDYIRGKLPPTCLISMVAQLHHLQEPLGVYAQKIGGIIKTSIKIAFQRIKPKEERDIQENAEAALSAAKERLNRESPMLCYSLVQTKPDFSTNPQKSVF
jgi:7-cyano-7-deazaguanine synthase in queuosine biosynthesis